MAHIISSKVGLLHCILSSPTITACSINVNTEYMPIC